MVTFVRFHSQSSLACLAAAHLSTDEEFREYIEGNSLVYLSSNLTLRSIHFRRLHGQFDFVLKKKKKKKNKNGKKGIIAQTELKFLERTKIE